MSRRREDKKRKWKRCILRNVFRGCYKIFIFMFSFNLEDLFWIVICLDKIWGFYFKGKLGEKILKGNY